MKEPSNYNLCPKDFEKCPSRGFESVTDVANLKTKNDPSRYICSAPEIQRMIVSHVPHKKPLLKVSHPHLLISSQMSLQLEHSVRSFHYDNEKHHDGHSVPSEGGHLSEISSVEIKDCINDVFDFELLKSPVFMLFAVSNFFTSIGFNAPFLYAKDRAIQMGINDSRASFLISSIGIGNTLGRVIYGYLSTTRYINRLQLYNASLVISGLVIVLSSFAVSYGLMITYTLSFGLFTG